VLHGVLVQVVWLGCIIVTPVPINLQGELDINSLSALQHGVLYIQNFVFKNFCIYISPLALTHSFKRLKGTYISHSTLPYTSHHVRPRLCCNINTFVAMFT